MAAWLESAWLARYLERQLDGEELAWFEAYLLDKPELLGMVEAENALRDTLAVMAMQERGGAASTVRAQDAQVTGTSARSHSVPWMTIAASLVLGVGAGWFVRDGHAPPSDDVVANPTRVVYDTMRGAAVGPDMVRGGDRSSWVLIEIAVPSAAKDISLRLEQAEIPLSRDADGFVTVMVPREKLPEQARLMYGLDGAREHRDISFKDMTMGASRPGEKE
jgi:hypothetical protein